MSEIGLPPGPRLPVALQSWMWLLYPTRVQERCADLYGTPFTLRLLLLGATVFVSDSVSMRTLFAGEQDAYHAGEAYTIMEPVLGPASLLLLDGDRHLAMRRMLLPPLRAERLDRWRAKVVEATEAEIASWPLDRPFALRPSMERITLEVIMELVFGVRDPFRAKRLRELLPGLMDVTRPQGLAFAIPALRLDLGASSPWGRLVRLRANVDTLLFAEIEQRRQEDLSCRDDILSLLLRSVDGEGRGLSDAELRDELVTLLLAGHDTIASSLAWAFERLVRHPGILAELVEDVEAGSERYVDAVIQETLRVRPVVAQVQRKLMRRVEVGGWDLPQGTVVAAALHLVHRDPSVYDDPAAFRPRRFLEGGAEGSYAWVPFGGGVRRCIGAGLASMEMRAVITTMLRQVRLVAPSRGAERPRARGVTVEPSRGGEVVLLGRR